VPWCDDCSRFYNPNSLRPDGTCPTCGRKVAEPGAVTTAEPLPWHFKLMLGAVVLYLGWRLVQGIAWLVEAL
jgi:hypothetical protein